MPNGPEVLDSLEALIAGPARDRLRVGVALPMSGVNGMIGPSALDAAMLAGSEIEATRTHSQRRLEFVTIDSGAAASRVAQIVSDLVVTGSVDAFVALHNSDTTEAVRRAVPGLRVPYLLAAAHEAQQREGAFYFSGESPEQLGGGLSRVMHDRDAWNWAIIGTDYVWPRAMRAAASAAFTENGGHVVYERLMPVGSVRAMMPRIVDEIVASGADGVVINMACRDLASALLAIRARKLDQRLIRFSGALAENVLYAVGGDTSDNLYSSLHTFDSLQSDRRRELNDRQRSAFGPDAPVFDSWAEHCYDGIHLIASLDRAGLLTPESFKPSSVSSTPAEAVALRREYDMHLAVAAGMTFDVI